MLLSHAERSNPAQPLVSPFDFTGELRVTARRTAWCLDAPAGVNPTSGTFLTRDPFAGRAEQPYSRVLVAMVSPHRLACYSMRSN